MTLFLKFCCSFSSISFSLFLRALTSSSSSSSFLCPFVVLSLKFLLKSLTFLGFLATTALSCVVVGVVGVVEVVVVVVVVVVVDVGVRRRDGTEGAVCSRSLPARKLPGVITVFLREGVAARDRNSPNPPVPALALLPNLSWDDPIEVPLSRKRDVDICQADMGSGGCCCCDCCGEGGV